LLHSVQQAITAEATPNGVPVRENPGASAFDVTVDPGASETFTAPDEPGSYEFTCTFHSNMHGTLKVS